MIWPVQINSSYRHYNMIHSGMEYIMYLRVGAEARV